MGERKSHISLKENPSIYYYMYINCVSTGFPQLFGKCDLITVFVVTLSLSSTLIYSLNSRLFGQVQKKKKKKVQKYENCLRLFQTPAYVGWGFLCGGKLAHLVVSRTHSIVAASCTRFIFPATESKTPNLGLANPAFLRDRVCRKFRLYI